jgi:hypothetical protein
VRTLEQQLNSLGAERGTRLHDSDEMFVQIAPPLYSRPRRGVNGFLLLLMALQICIGRTLTEAVSGSTLLSAYGLFRLLLGYAFASGVAEETRQTERD